MSQKSRNQQYELKYSKKEEKLGKPLLLKDFCFIRALFKKPKFKVDWSGRCSTPAGLAGQVRPHRRNVFCAEEAHRPPRGKRAPVAQINHYPKCYYVFENSL
ncbi:hypothetical protein AB986_20635 [Alkalihalobacillus macyae]|uniref:Uncharacterized protein n=1 Tax=Guptibacillus hwajinpoensis TaxID=208199 RepID=A0A0J6CI08_9BACL|nr:hypothetical protein AB986_20635 [Alkalihalobacillus macyae]